MKIELPNQKYKYITENSSECSADTAFVLSAQNKNYLQDAKDNGAHSIINIKEITLLMKK